MSLNQKLITKISRFSLLSLLTTTALTISTPPENRSVLAQEYSGCFMVDSKGRVVKLNDLCPGDAAIEAQRELAKQENPIIMVNGVVEPDSNFQNTAHIRMTIKNRSDLPHKILELVTEVKDISFGVPETLGTVSIIEPMTLEPGQEITVSESFLTYQVGADSTQDLGVDLADVVFLD